MQHRLALASLMLAVTQSCAAADDYPSRNLRVVLGFAPGASTDHTARMIGQHLTEAWGKPVVVDNRPGADGNIAAEIVVKSDIERWSKVVRDNGIAVE